MAYEKQTWEDYPSTNTPITSDRLNHIEQGIYDNSTDIVSTATQLRNEMKTNIITNQEVATNEYIDGERVYVKRISTGSLPNATTTIVATGLNFSEIDIQKVNGMATRIKGGEKTSLPIPNNGVEVWLSGNNLNINCTINRSEFSGYVNIYYTKN